MLSNKSNLEKFVVATQDTVRFIKEENYKNEDFLQGMEYVLDQIKKVFDLNEEDLKRVDLEKANYEILEESGEWE